MTMKPCARHSSGAHFAWINHQPYRLFISLPYCKVGTTHNQSTPLLSDESQAMPCRGATQVTLHAIKVTLHAIQVMLHATQVTLHAIQVTLCTVVCQVNRLTCHMVPVPLLQSRSLKCFLMCLLPDHRCYLRILSMHMPGM